MVHNLYVSSFLWILGKILLRNKFLKILHLLKEKSIQTKILKVDKNWFEYGSKTV